MQHACSNCAATIPRSARRWSECLRAWIATCPICAAQVVCRDHAHRRELRVLLDLAASASRIVALLILFFGASVSLGITLYAWLWRVEYQRSVIFDASFPYWLLLKTPFLLYCLFGAVGVSLASSQLTYWQRVGRWSIVSIVLSWCFMNWFSITGSVSTFDGHNIAPVFMGICGAVLGVILGCALRIDRVWNREAARRNRRRLRATFARQ